MKRIIFSILVIFILFFNSTVNADTCDTNDINRLKEIAKNVDISYEHNVYVDPDDEEGFMASVYTVSVVGITDELYIVDDGGNRYYSKDAEEGVIYINTSDGRRNYYLISLNCTDDVLYTKTLNLPYFNFNSLSDECKKEEFKDLDICAKFIDDKKDIIQRNEFEEKIELEQEKSFFDKTLNFIKNNSLLLLISLIVVIALIVFFSFRYYKRSALEWEKKYLIYVIVF